jgi:hypothetical protein
MEGTKWLKPPDSVSRLGDSAHLKLLVNIQYHQSAALQSCGYLCTSVSARVRRPDMKITLHIAEHTTLAVLVQGTGDAAVVAAITRAIDDLVVHVAAGIEPGVVPYVCKF